MSDKPKFLDSIKDSKFAQFVRDKVKPVAGDILEVVGDLTGRESIERVGQFLNNRKEDNEQIRALAQEFEKYKMQWQLEYESLYLQHGLEEMKIEVQDRESARTREVEFMKTNGGKRDWLMGVVVICGIVMMFGVLASLVFVNVPEANKELAYMAYGSVLTIGTSIFSYYVGSSRGSASKDKTISHLSK